MGWIFWSRVLMATLFNLTKQVTGTVGSSAWIDLGLIPNTYKIWIGSWNCSNPSKSISYSLYTNNLGQSTGSTSTCTKLASMIPKTGASITQDLYKNGLLHTVTVKSTGVEHWWVNLTSKSGTSGTYMFTIYYTQE
jgi:hypothetical protein